MTEVKKSEAEEKPLFPISRQSMLDLQKFLTHFRPVGFTGDQTEFNIQKMDELLASLMGLPDDIEKRREEYLKKFTLEDVDNAMAGLPGLVRNAHILKGGFLIRRGGSK